MKTEAKERPILFSGPMVRALLEGRKTQTRRIVKRTDSGRVKAIGSARNWHLDDPLAVLACPYGQPGDRLWVRETFRLFDSHEECSCYDACRCAGAHGKPIYRADHSDDSKWTPSIFMRREYSRITLEIGSVRVERLQDISEEDAKAEGISEEWLKTAKGREGLVPVFKELWESINGPGSWDANPRVWVVEFKRNTSKEARP